MFFEDVCTEVERWILTRPNSHYAYLTTTHAFLGKQRVSVKTPSPAPETLSVATLIFYVLYYNESRL